MQTGDRGLHYAGTAFSPASSATKVNSSDNSKSKINLE
jgi:hypothetical protein